MTKTIGKYNLERVLGRGGMGTVWIAHDTQLLRRVAIKLMHHQEGTSEVDFGRFEREARAIARLQHPHIIQIFDYGKTDEGVPYIVMELLDGEDLATRLLRGGPMSLAAFMPILLQSAKALDAAHQAGIIHRDLKPANIYLARQGGDINIKILDFGVAAVNQPLTESSGGMLTLNDQLVGTPRYMSPEQARAMDTDHRADLWSLAVVAYEALTGTLPFDAKNLTAVLLQICMDKHDPPSSLVTGLTEEVDQFFDRALAKDPNSRFPSALEMAAAFAELGSQGGSSKATKVLVVDDEPDLALLIKQRFRRQIRRKQFEFLFANDGQAALDELEKHPDVEIALTDINMPGMDGLTFLSKVGDVAPALKSVVISAYSDMSNIRRAMNHGAFDFLVKPLDFRDLETTMDKAVREARELRKALRLFEENQALRMFVDPGAMERLLPLLRVAESAGESIYATIVAIGVHGVPDLIRERGPLKVIEILNRNFDLLVPILHTYEGSIVRFTGEVVLALFVGGGHSLRALQASVEARAALDQHAETAIYGHGVRIGVAAGTVVAGAVGSPSTRRIDYVVFGEPVSAARALQSVAQKNQVLFTAELIEAAAAIAPYEMGEEVEIAPKGPRVMSYALVGLLERGDRSEARGSGHTLSSDTMSMTTVDNTLLPAAMTGVAVVEAALKQANAADEDTGAKDQDDEEDPEDQDDDREDNGGGPDNGKGDGRSGRALLSPNR